MKIESFLNYKNFRWLWINILFVVIATVIYMLDSPLGGKNGGTYYGYTVGILAAIGIFYLMWFGVRKRAYYSKYTTLRGALGAHIWLGIALFIIVPLHCGFSFGWNVHTLAYALMVLTIISGIWGALVYLTLAPQIDSHRGGLSITGLLAQIDSTSAELAKLAKDQRSPALSKLINKVDIPIKESYFGLLFSKARTRLDQHELAPLLADLKEDEREDGLKAVALADKKEDSLVLLKQEIKTLFWIKSWLYIHLPVSCLLLVALCVHIFVVLFMR